MPDWSGDATALRSKQFSRLWLAVFSGSVVYTADIDAVNNAHTVSTLTISSGVGTVGDIKRGAEVKIYNSAGEYKGNVRVRRAGTVSSSSLAIAETAKGFVEIVAGDTLEVLDDHRVRPVFPESSSDFDPDKETYTDQTEDYPPVAHSGGHVAAWVDTGQSYATLDFFGSSSYALDDDSGGTLTHSWTFPSGSTPTSSTTADPTGIQIPQGVHRIEHTVTDSSNSKTWTQYVYCGVYNTANPPYGVNVEGLSLSGAEDSGWELSFELLESAGIDTLPDGAWVVLFADDFYGGTQQSFGNLNEARSTIKFTGILRNDTSNTDVERKQISYTAVSPIQILREMAGFSQVFEDTETAINWQDLEDMSSKKVLIHLLRTYTTATDMLDLYHAATDYPYPVLNFQKATPYEQISEVLDGVDARFASDRTCNLMIQKRQELYELGDRSGLTTTFTLDTEDIISLTSDRPHTETLRLLEGRAFVPQAENLEAVFARFPSLTPGENSQDSVIDWMIADSQSDLNIRTGLRGGKLNQVYIEADGYRQFAPKLTIQTRLDIFDFYQEWVAFTLDATSNWREVDLSGFRWIVRQINVTWDVNGAHTVQLTLDAETAAPEAQTYVPPVIDGIQLPEITLPPFDWIPPLDIQPFPIITWSEGTGNACVIPEGAVFQVTSNFNDDVPTWTPYDHSATITEDIIDWTTDASSAFFVSGTGAIGGWVCTSSYIYYISDIFAASPTITLQHTFASATNTTKVIDADFIFNPGTHVCCTYTLINNKTVAVYTTDGTNWTEVDVTISGTGTGAGSAVLHYSTASAGTVYIMCPVDHNSSGSTTLTTLFVSTASGAGPWTEVDNTYTYFTTNQPGRGTQTLYFNYRGAANRYAQYGGERIAGINPIWRIGIGDTTTPTDNIIEVNDSNGEWTIGNQGKFQIQCAYTRDKVYYLLHKGSPRLAAIWKSTQTKTLSPTLIKISATEITVADRFDGLDCSPDGTEIVIWSSGSVYYYSEDTGDMLTKASSLTNGIRYVFVK